MGNLGMGVMLNMLGGNFSTVQAINKSIGKIIERVRVEDNKLLIRFSDGITISVWDDGQSCCEDRYMKTDDDLDEFVGATLISYELKSAPNVVDEWVEHEIQFLDVNTSNGTFQIVNHNEHNGYYGGFAVCAEILE
jgi:hypothetical protein